MVVITKPNIWSSMEIYCVVHGFPYDEYLDYRTNYECKCRPLYKEAYILLRRMFYKQMELEMRDLANE